MKLYSRVCARINLDAVAWNFEEMHRNLKPGTKMTAVIKADGYGHGAVPIGRMIEPYDYIWGYATATPEEALQLRHAGLKKPILLLGKAFPEAYEDILKNEIRPCVFELETAKELSEKAVSYGITAPIHLAVDTGMSRIGFADNADAVSCIREISSLPNLKIEGIFTHFARADEKDREPAMIQLERFRKFLAALEKEGIDIPIRDCSNSAGIIRIREANMSMVRAGITLYGLWPSDEVEKDVLHLKPAMSLVSHITYVKELEKGCEISYGGTYTTHERTRVATIPAGYADGYPRLLSNKGYVLIHEKKAPILGRVCMDQFMVNVSDIPDVRAGDEVILLGRQGAEEITAEEIGALSGRFNYELVCGISKRVPREYLRNGEIVEQVDYFE